VTFPLPTFAGGMGNENIIEQIAVTSLFVDRMVMDISLIFPVKPIRRSFELST
jgi:hypothetical protein